MCIYIKYKQYTKQHIHTCVQTHGQTHTHTYTYTQINTHTRAHTYTHKHIHTHIDLQIVSSFNRTSDTKTPARSTNSLIFNRRYSTCKSHRYIDYYNTIVNIAVII